MAQGRGKRTKAGGDSGRGRGGAEAAVALKQGLLLHQSGRLAEAEAVYNRILASYPGNVETWSFLGLLAFHAGHPDIALERIGHALLLDPESAIAHLNLGLVQQGRGRFDEAAASFEKACALKPDLVDAHHGLAMVRYAQGRREEAISGYERTLRLRPDHIEARTNLGVALRASGRLEEAVASHREALRRNPRYPSAHYNLANTLAQLRRSDEAIEHYREAIALKPDGAEIHFNLANLLSRLGRAGEAEVHFNRALELRPDDEVLRFLASAQRHVNQERMPAALVGSVFDSYAKTFDAHLRGKLEYRTPEALAEAIHAAIGEGAPRLATVDLGCGTGLLGPLLRPIASRLVGMDLSEGMLERARERGCYDELVRADLVEYLKGCGTGSVGLITAADVLVYIGDLEAVFAEAARALHAGGLFAFSVEAESDESGAGYRLQRTARFTHTRGYLEELAGAHGFRTIALYDQIIRKQNDLPVAGYIAVFARLGS